MPYELVLYAAKGNDSMLSLPDVTLVMVETREHDLAREAIFDCMSKVEFGDVLILTDNPGKFTQVYCPVDDATEIRLSNGYKARWHKVPDWPEKVGWSRSWWFDVPPLLQTSHTLNIQWDSWVWDTSMWRDEYLKYDYIGAPWWYKDGKNVGNGGFSLVSTTLKRYIRDRRFRFPCDTPVDDDLLCRKYRPALEEAGFRWAPEKLAHNFAFECARPSPDSRHFGFHALFNWDEVLDKDRFLERIKMAAKSSYITNPNGVVWKAFTQKHPQLAKDVLAEIKGV